MSKDNGGSAWQPIETAPKDGTRFLAAQGGEVDITIHIPLTLGKHACGWVVDTDDDPEAIQPYPSHPVRGAPDICLCARCREREETYRENAP